MDDANISLLGEEDDIEGEDRVELDGSLHVVVSSDAAETDGMLFDGPVDDSRAVAVTFIDVLVVDGGTSA